MIPTGWREKQTKSQYHSSGYTQPKNHIVKSDISTPNGNVRLKSYCGLFAWYKIDGVVQSDVDWIWSHSELKEPVNFTKTNTIVENNTCKRCEKSFDKLFRRKLPKSLKLEEISI